VPVKARAHLQPLLLDLLILGCAVAGVLGRDWWLTQAAMSKRQLLEAGGRKEIAMMIPVNNRL